MIEHENKLTPVLKEIHDYLWEFNVNAPNVQYGFKEADLVYAVKIFMDTLLEVSFNNRDKNDDIKKLAAKAEFIGSSIREIVKQYSGFDLPDFYNEGLKYD